MEIILEILKDGIAIQLTHLQIQMEVTLINQHTVLSLYFFFF